MMNVFGIDIIEHEGQHYVLNDWNGEKYLRCWRCDGNNPDIPADAFARFENFEIRPVYGDEDQHGDFPIIGYEVTQTKPETPFSAERKRDILIAYALTEYRDHVEDEMRKAYSFVVSNPGTQYFYIYTDGTTLYTDRRYADTDDRMLMCEITEDPDWTLYADREDIPDPEDTEAYDAFREETQEWMIDNFDPEPYIDDFLAHIQ